MWVLFKRKAARKGSICQVPTQIALVAWKKSKLGAPESELAEG